MSNSIFWNAKVVKGSWGYGTADDDANNASEVPAIFINHSEDYDNDKDNYTTLLVEQIVIVYADRHTTKVLVKYISYLFY